MNARRRRQTRTRRIGAGGYPPYRHNADRARRVVFDRIIDNVNAASKNFRQITTAWADFVPAVESFTFAWALRERTELDRTISHALLLGMDETEAHEMVEDFRLTRQGTSAHSAIREWEDLRDEITNICLGSARYRR